MIAWTLHIRYFKIYLYLVHNNIGDPVLVHNLSGALSDYCNNLSCAVDGTQTKFIPIFKILYEINQWAYNFQGEMEEWKN